MKAIDKLRNILCEVKEIKEDLMELRFGCVLICTDQDEKFNIKLLWEKDDYFGFMLLNDDEKPNELPIVDWGNLSTDVLEEDIKTWYYEIIWNPIQERHLRMYCRENKIPFLLFYDCPLYSFDILDDSKDLINQEESVIQSIIDFLENNS